LLPDGKLARKFVGQDVAKILSEIGINVGPNVRMAVVDVPSDHPFVFKEMLMPVLPLVRVPDIDAAISLAVKAELGNLHTAMMHSMNVENLHKMARAVQATIFVKNGPSYAGLGFGGEGFTTMTIAGSTGEGLTNARTFTRERRCVLKDYFRIV
jgi:propionaldehyde dehydrogenase